MTVRIAFMCEGATEKAFLPVLRPFLAARLADRMPRLSFRPANGRLPKGDRLKREVELHLKDHDHVVALTDVYTGTGPPEFTDAADARQQMHAWVGGNPRFHPHAAQYEFEAWLIPYWPRIQGLAKSRQRPPSGTPESVNHGNPPSRVLKNVFGTGERRIFYQKILHASAILRDQDLAVAAQACPELKSMLNTILTLSSGEPL
jgi:hypothetical protein